MKKIILFLVIISFLACTVDKKSKVETTSDSLKVDTLKCDTLKIGKIKTDSIVKTGV